MIVSKSVIISNTQMISYVVSESGSTKDHVDTNFLEGLISPKN